ncbi:MAG: hypothetical protein WC516_04760 [Patescibacteria group bacterium]|jgi:hypothetical protein
MVELYGTDQAMDIDKFREKAILNGGGFCPARKYITKFGNIILVQGKLEEKFVK